jgi:hypothetical protein
MELELLDLAATAVQDSAGVVVRVLEREEGSHAEEGRPDALVQVNERPLVVEIKATIDRVETLRKAQITLRKMAEASKLAAVDTLLVTHHLTSKLLDACRELNLNAVDCSGNAHLAWDNTLVVVSGRPRQTFFKARTEERLGWTTSAVRLALIALAAPEGLNATQRSIATFAGISLGSVGSTLDWLESRHFLQRRASGVTVIRADELLAEWSVVYPARLRPRLHVQRFASTFEPRRWAKIEITPGLWSGEVAAVLHHGDLRPTTAEIYVDPAARRDLVRRLAQDFHLRPDPSGTFTVLDRFWGPDQFPSYGTVPWPVVYADLLHIDDPRTDEAAEKIKKDAHVN